MKRIITFIMIFAAAISFSGCSAGTGVNSVTTASQSEKAPQDKLEELRKLVEEVETLFSEFKTVTAEYLSLLTDESVISANTDNINKSIKQIEEAIEAGKNALVSDFDLKTIEADIEKMKTNVITVTNALKQWKDGLEALKVS